jgi:hypothetical protein
VLESEVVMLARALAALFVLALLPTTFSAQSPALVDTSKIGPQVGATVPAVSGVDQFGKPQTLATVSGPKGAMIVFFRSADW